MFLKKNLHSDAQWLLLSDTFQ